MLLLMCVDVEQVLRRRKGMQPRLSPLSQWRPVKTASQCIEMEHFRMCCSRSLTGCDILWG